MRTRDGIPIDIIWVLVSLTHPRINDVLAGAATKHRERLPVAVLSVNRDVAGTQALVKIATTEAALRALLPNPAEAAIIRVYTEADYGEAVVLVTAVAWTGPAAEG